jgi:hypothetical protein
MQTIGATNGSNAEPPIGTSCIAAMTHVRSCRFPMWHLSDGAPDTFGLSEGRGMEREKAASSIGPMIFQVTPLHQMAGLCGGFAAGWSLAHLLP